MFDIFFLLFSLSMHRASVRAMAGDTSPVVTNRLLQYINRHDPGLATTSHFFFARNYPADIGYVLTYTEQPSSTRIRLDAQYDTCMHLAYGYIIWTGATSPTLFITVKEAALRYVSGDSSPPVTKRLNRYLKYHPKDVQELVIEMYMTRYIDKDWEIIPDWAVEGCVDDAHSSIIMNLAENYLP